MKAVLIIPNMLGVCLGKDWRMNPYISPPLGVLYVAAALEQSGFDVSVIDLNVQCLTTDEFLSRATEATIVGFYVLSMATVTIAALISMVRSVNPTPRIICGGPHLNATQEPVSGSDLSFIGEAETTIGTVSHLLVRGDFDRLRKCAGVWFRVGNEWIHSGPAVITHDLDRSPKPARHLLDASLYGRILGVRLGKTTASISAARGCPHNCRFCTKSGIYPYRTRSPEKVVDEIAEIVEAGYDLLVFNDDDFCASPAWTLAIAREMRRRDLRIRSIIQARVDNLSDELVLSLAEMGIWLVMMGIESGSQSVLDFYRKGTTIEQVAQAIRLLEKHGIFGGGYFIIGSPGTGHTDILTSSSFAVGVPLDVIALRILEYQPGSALWRDYIADTPLEDSPTAILAGSNLGTLSYEELLSLMHRFYRRFYLRPTHLWRITRKSLQWRNWSILRLALKACVYSTLGSLTKDEYARVGSGLHKDSVGSTAKLM